MFTQTRTATKTATDYNAAFNSVEAIRHTVRPAAPAAPQYSELPEDLRRIEIDRTLPRELREAARDMDWGLFMATFAPEPTLSVTLEAEEKINWVLSEYHFDVHATPKTRAARHTSETVDASGPIRAIGEALNRHNRYVEILSFHQAEIFGQSLTMLKVGHSERHTRIYWAIGFGATPADSAAAAMSAATCSGAGAALEARA